MAPYCAIPRDYLSDTPLLRAMGFLVSRFGQLGAIPHPLFLGVSPWESMRSGGAIPPLRRGISAILARYPLKTRQMGAIPPSAILSRKGIARYGGVSRTGPLRTSPRAKEPNWREMGSLRDSRTTTKYSKWHFPVEKSLDYPPWGLLKLAGNPVIAQ